MLPLEGIEEGQEGVGTGGQETGTGEEEERGQRSGKRKRGEGCGDQRK